MTDKNVLDRNGTEQNMTGPWVLALGTLALGVGAVAARLVRRQRTDDRED